MDKCHKFARVLPDNAEKTQVLQRLYWGEGLIQQEIAKRFGVTKWTIGDWMRKLGIKCRHGSDAQRITRVQRKGIIKPDLSPSLQLTYVLGVLKGDGCAYIRKHKFKTRSLVMLNVVDYDFAESFAKALRSIKFNPSIHTKKTKWRDQYVVIAHSFIFTEWYQKLSLEDIEKMLTDEGCIREFIRGFYESDGSFGVYNVHGYDVKRICLVNTDPSLLKLVQKLLSTLDYRFRLTGPYNSRNKTVWEPRYHLTTNRRDQVERFLLEIKPCIKNGEKRG